MLQKKRSVTSWIEGDEKVKISQGKDAHEIHQHQIEGKEEA
jgi:hypothetical protein